MRIGVTYENGEIFQHFGHTSQFKLYEVENGEIKETQIIDTNGQGHGALASFLTNAGVEVLIAVELEAEHKMHLPVQAFSCMVA